VFGLIHTHALIFDGRSDEEGDVWSFRFHTNAQLRWRAGQHGLLRLPGWRVKPFSVASAPEEGDIVIGTSLVSNSPYKQRLAALTKGDRVVLHGPVMNFTLDGAGTDVVMLAQGLGITPFRSMLRHLALQRDTAVSATLIHVGAEHAYRCDTEADATRAYYPRHAHEFNAALTEVVGKHPDATYFIAGQRGYVKATAESLTAARVARGRIRRDTYYGYTPRGTSVRSADTQLVNGSDENQ
jgi:ferredoxin-NADP reductase